MKRAFILSLFLIGAISAAFASPARIFAGARRLASSHSVTHASAVARKHVGKSLLTCSSGGWSVDDCDSYPTIGTFSTSSVDLTIQNWSGTNGTVAVTSDCGAAFSACSASPNNPTLSGDGEGIVVTFSFTSRGYTGSQDIHVTVSGGSPTLVATIHVTISGPSHTLSVDAGMTNNDFQSADLCATSCFAAAYSFSTVPFFTLDQPRSVSLVYNGDRALPRPFVYVDATPDGGGTGIQRYSLSANVNGSAVTFVNGDGTLYFSGSTGTRRLVGQFDARSLSTGVYPMSLIVTAMYTDSVTLADTVNTELMVVNEGASPVAVGWSVGGLQRLYFPTSGYMISEGDGTAVRFTALSAQAPDFSVLTYSSSVYTRTYPDGTRALFNSSGYLTSIVDIQGRSTTFDYDGSNRLVRVKDPMAGAGSGAQYDSLTYGGSGLGTILEKTASTTLRTTTVTIGANGSISAIQDPDGVSTSFTYDGDKKLSTITDRKGSTSTLAYDTLTWKLSALTMPTVAVDAGSGSTSNTQPVVTYAAWQGIGLPRSSTSAGSPAAAPTPDTIVGRVTDPLSQVSKYTVNRYGQPMVATNALSQATTYLRTGFLPYEIDRADGGIDQFTYDSYGRVTWQQPSGREATSFTRNGLYSQVDSVKGNGSRNEVLQYDGSGNLSRIDYAVHSGDSAQYVTYAYDATTKQLATVTDQNGNETGYFFDAKFGNVDSTESASGRTFSTRRFDVYGRDSATRGSGTATATTIYDAMNRPTRYKDGVHSDSMLVRYDALDDTTLTDRLGNTYRTVRNALGWVTQSCDASANCSSFRYDASGALTSSTNRRSQRIDLVRDALGRVTSKSGTNTSSDSFSYASNGHDYVASNGAEIDSVFSSPGNGSAAAYDSVVTRVGGMRFRTFGRSRRGISGADTLSIITSLGSLVMNSRIMAYSDVGSLDSIATGVHKIRFTHNADGIPSKLVSTGGGEESLTSTALGTPRDRKNNLSALDSAFRRSYHYDVASRVDQMQNATIDRQQLNAYDSLGELTSVAKRHSCSLAGTDSLTADGSGISYTCPDTLSLNTYSYDAMGNRTDTTTVTTGNRYSAFHGATISYDADGNMTQKYKSDSANRQLYWSAESRLDSAVLNAWSMVKYDYNALGKPVIKYNRDAGSGWSVDTYFVWDGDQLLLELDGSGNRKADYIYTPGTVDQPAAQTIGATSVTAIRDFRFDASGNVTGTVDGVTVSQVASYDAWGTPSATGNWDNHLLWKGLMWEGGVDSLYYARNRWYDPELGRFASEDPIGHAGGDNLYAFGGNDPVNASDPSGTTRCTQEQLLHHWKDEGGNCLSPTTLPPVITYGSPTPLPPLPALPPEPRDPSPIGPGIPDNRLKMAAGLTVVLPATSASVVFSDRGIAPGVCNQMGGLVGFTEDTYLYWGEAPSAKYASVGIPAISVSVHGNGFGLHLGAVLGPPISFSLGCGTSQTSYSGYSTAKVGYQVH